MDSCRTLNALLKSRRESREVHPNEIVEHDTILDNNIVEFLSNESKYAVKKVCVAVFYFVIFGGNVIACRMKVQETLIGWRSLPMSIYGLYINRNIVTKNFDVQKSHTCANVDFFARWEY